MKVQSIRGVKDILPAEIPKWHYVEKMAHSVFSRYGFAEIRVPIFEKTALFQRGIGETTDIVQKEMYTFEDRSGDQITLRPEGTAGVVRSYIEHKLYNPPGLEKMYYIGPMFRYERPQAGRFRQFYQIGVEAMGSPDPAVDAEVMTMLMDFFSALGLNDVYLQLNSLGCPECRPQYRETLKAAIKPHLQKLCTNCNTRYEKNPLRVLDCKVETCAAIATELPKTSDCLCADCEARFGKVKQLLDGANIPWRHNPLLVRGLDYYSRTAFEVKSESLGSQDAICGGGRYDQLVEEFDGPATPCFGFALGMERLISLVPFDDQVNLQSPPDLFMVCLGAEAERYGFKLAHELRLQNLRVERDFDSSSMKSQMRKANKSGATLTLIVGDNELQDGKLILKNMQDGSQAEVAIAGQYLEEIKQRLHDLGPS
ncbi:MAG: histidine--tRNA ligase [Candidatus Nitrohelix vancouverensis]|uniref:Histidine--tRNA ligase n=1 Tax=Candidatus Nitrohelix vancouverensis TaxID=2705534 RepID=A0A7T0C3H7_9BACT|nr:MAG: histidine--tRNA ligase [Candidatus Nitrohelix vancouverensis]